MNERMLPLVLGLQSHFPLLQRGQAAAWRRHRAGCSACVCSARWLLSTASLPPLSPAPVRPGLQHLNSLGDPRSFLSLPISTWRPSFRDSPSSLSTGGRSPLTASAAERPGSCPAGWCRPHLLPLSLLVPTLMSPSITSSSQTNPSSCALLIPSYTVLPSAS